MTNTLTSCIRRRFALVVLPMIAVVGWFVAWPAYQRHRAIQEIEWVGGTVIREPFGPPWFTKVVQLGRVTGVDLAKTGLSDNDSKHLSGMTSLEGLLLGNTQVTNEGLKHLKGLTNLEWLSLTGTTVTDEGITHLSGLTTLRYLSLGNTQVTEEGVKTLQESLPNCRILWQSESD